MITRRHLEDGNHVVLDRILQRPTMLHYKPFLKGLCVELNEEEQLESDRAKAAAAAQEAAAAEADADCDDDVPALVSTLEHICPTGRLLDVLGVLSAPVLAFERNALLLALALDGNLSTLCAMHAVQRTGLSASSCHGALGSMAQHGVSTQSCHRCCCTCR